MTSTSTCITRAVHHLRGPLPGIAIGLAYFCVFLPEDSPRAVDEFDRDEGFSLMRALLVNRGFSLYSEIWSDQPPGYTYLLAAFTRVAGELPEIARLLSCALSSALLAAVYQIARGGETSWRGHAAGLAAALALVMSEGYVHYSAAVMLTLPSVALVTLAWLVLQRPRAGQLRLILAGALCGLALGVKGIVIPLLPSLILLLDRGEVRLFRRRVRVPLRSSSIVGLACLATLSLIFAPSLRSAGLLALYETHVSGAGVMHYKTVWQFLSETPWLFVLAILGLTLGLRSNRSARTAALWVAFAVAALALHAPVWDHHRFLITIPAAVLAGIGFLESLNLTHHAGSLRARVVGHLGAVGTVALLCLPASTGGLRPLDKARAHHALSPSMRQALAAVRRHAPEARLAVTSNQMFAYRLGLPVPPQLAVTSIKRWQTGALSDDIVRKEIREWKPDVVILTNRWPRGLRQKIIEKDLGQRYEQVYSNRKARELTVHVRKATVHASPRQPKSSNHL